MNRMKMLLIAAIASLSFAGAAFAGEGYNPSQSVGVPTGFNDGTPQECKPRLSRGISRTRPSRPPVLGRPAQV
jgi:hypothetical protein